MFLRLLSACLTLGLLAWSPSAHAVTVDYADPTLSQDDPTPTLTMGGVVATGSANVELWTGHGLGITGGEHSVAVDITEFINFSFSSPVLNVSYFVGGVSNLDGDSLSGERFLEAFGIGGVSLGVVLQSGDGTFLVSSLFGDVPIIGFRLTADVDGSVIGSLTYDISTVPVPAALPLFASGLAGMWLFNAWRRRRQTSA